MKSSDTQYSVFALINGKSVEIAHSLTSEGDACLLAFNYFHENSEKYPVKVIKSRVVKEVLYTCSSQSIFYDDKVFYDDEVFSSSREVNREFLVSCWLDCII